MGTRLVRAEALPGTTTVDVSDRTARELGFLRSFWLNEINNARAFARVVDQAAVSAELSHCQLFNPAGSGITIVIRRVSLRLLTAGEFSLTSHNIELTTDHNPGFNLDSGATDGSGRVRRQTNTMVLGTNLENYNAADTGTVVPVDDWWMRLGAGEGFNVVSNVANIRMVVNFRWIEF